MGADWGPVIVAVALFIFLSPGLLFQFPARFRVVEFGRILLQTHTFTKEIPSEITKKLQASFHSNTKKSYKGDYFSLTKNLHSHHNSFTLYHQSLQDLQSTSSSPSLPPNFTFNHLRHLRL
ncbi:hypothetical protein RYX36_028767 [Vicia faba]